MSCLSRGLPLDGRQSNLYVPTVRRESLTLARNRGSRPGWVGILSGRSPESAFETSKELVSSRPPTPRTRPFSLRWTNRQNPRNPGGGVGPTVRSRS